MLAQGLCSTSVPPAVKPSMHRSAANHNSCSLPAAASVPGACGTWRAAPGLGPALAERRRAFLLPSPAASLLPSARSHCGTAPGETSSASWDMLPHAAAQPCREACHGGSDFLSSALPCAVVCAPLIAVPLHRLPASASCPAPSAAGLLALPPLPTGRRCTSCMAGHMASWSAPGWQSRMNSTRPRCCALRCTCCRLCSR